MAPAGRRANVAAPAPVRAGLVVVLALCGPQGGGAVVSSSFRGAGVLQKDHLPVPQVLSDAPGEEEAAAPANLSLAGAGAWRPIRIGRTGDSKPDASDQESKAVTSAKCGAVDKAHSGSLKAERCPDSCPFYAQNRQDKDFCTFSCVAEDGCRGMNNLTQIGDKRMGVCRSCVVEGCKSCDTSTVEDRCQVCQSGYYLKEGQCWFKLGGSWVSVALGVIGALLLLVVLWVVDLAIRPVYNEAGLEHGLRMREKSKLVMKKDSTGQRKQFPLATNLLNSLVAGPGMTLHFNFQLFLMIWAVFVAAVWMFFAGFVDENLWRLGTRAFGTPRENCILVAWGYETQQALMWTKVAFLWIVYIGSFLLCMAYGVYQLRKFQETDYQHKTMKDFVAMIVGLPSVSGENDVEEELKAVVARISGEKPVGVSVAWNYLEHEEQINKAVLADINERERQFHTSSGNIAPCREMPEMNAVRTALYKAEQKVLGLPGNEVADDEAGTPRSEPERPLPELLRMLHTSPRAFAVFETQAARDTAMEACNAANGFEYAGASGITMETIEAEPDTVQWQNFGHSTTKEKSLKLLAGFGIIGLACLFWAVVFYAPYAYYVMTFNYENGRVPGFAVGLSFSMIVVVGNAIMYEVCAQLSVWVGFRFKDDREACYMILYTVACMFNVALDFVTTYYTAEKVMEGLGFRTYFGVPLSEIDDFTAKIETYGMQRSLAENTYGYAFPSTYLIPFLIEPFPAVLAPLLVGKMVVKSHPELQGRDAEEFLAMPAMEMGRYADLLLNIILGILIFYFPGGYTWMLFLAMAASHVWIYVFDHYRVLRAIPACTFASFDIEWWSQAMLAPIMGIIAACLVFKSNCEPGYHCTKGTPLIAACCLGWLVATALHIACLKYVVPKFGKPEPEEDPAADETFMTLSSQVPCSWFTANPVHCLRSRHKHDHQPACCFYELGREQYMPVNPRIGCHFRGDAVVQTEESKGSQSAERNYAGIGVYDSK